MRFSNIVRKEKILSQEETMGERRELRRFSKPDTAREPHFRLVSEIFTSFTSVHAFFFRTIFTDGREIVVIVLEPVCFAASVSTRSFNFYLLRHFARYRARNTELLRVLNFLERIACVHTATGFFNAIIARIVCK
jgi:hypothetical protein